MKGGKISVGLMMFAVLGLLPSAVAAVGLPAAPKERAKVLREIKQMGEKRAEMRERARERYEEYMWEKEQAQEKLKKRTLAAREKKELLKSKYDSTHPPAVVVAAAQVKTAAAETAEYWSRMIFWVPGGLLAALAIYLVVRVKLDEARKRTKAAEKARLREERLRRRKEARLPSGPRFGR